MCGAGCAGAHAEVVALAAKLESLSAQLRELKAKTAKSGASARFGPEKDRKSGSMAKGTFGKFGPMAKGDKGPPWMREWLASTCSRSVVPERGNPTRKTWVRGPGVAGPRQCSGVVLRK